MADDDGSSKDPETLVLGDGTTARLIARADGWILEVDGIRQSQIVGSGRPAGLASTRWMLAALGSGRRRVVHLGGGLMSLPRAVAAAHTEARQLVVELDPVLAELVREERFEWPEHVALEVADARGWLDAGGSPGWTAATCDAVVIDVFVGGRIPPSFTSRECFARARSLLAADGVLVVNSVAGGDLSFVRGQVATLQAELEHVSLIVQGSALHGLRFGNAVLVASAVPIDASGIRAALRGDPSRGALLCELDELVGDAAVVVDARSTWSPVPDLPDVGPALELLAQTRTFGSRLRGTLPGPDAPGTEQ